MIVVYGFAIFGAYNAALWARALVAVVRGETWPPDPATDALVARNRDLRDALKTAIDAYHEAQKHLVEAHVRRRAAEEAIEHLKRCRGCATTLLQMQDEAAKAGRPLLPPH